MKEYCVYILSNGARNLYIGVTSNLEKRLWEHSEGIHPDSFTARYNLDKLVFVAPFPTSLEMIAFEKQIKGWSRAKKLKLILAQNPDSRDLSRAGVKVADPSTLLRFAQDDVSGKVSSGMMGKAQQ
jgi:putative endonuclease